MIRPRQDSDLPALVQVLRAVHETDGYPGAWPSSPTAFVQHVAPLGAWVAELGGRAAGQVLLCRLPPDSGWDAAEHLMDIKPLFVSPSAWGLGLAEQLMRVALSEARRRGCPAVLETRADNRAANRFYARTGWQKAGTTRATWTDATGQHPRMQRYTAPPEPSTPRP